MPGPCCPSGTGTRGGTRTPSSAFVYKAVLFALLAVNAVYFAVAETPSKAVDAAAWLALLLLFEAETRYDSLLRIDRRRVALRIVRLAAAAAVAAATLAYVLEDNVLDAINSLLWMAVVVVLELDVRSRDDARRRRRAFAFAYVTLYGALAFMVLAWGLRGLWLDAYDAALWLIAFVTVELDVAAGKLSVDLLKTG